MNKIIMCPCHHSIFSMERELLNLISMLDFVEQLISTKKASVMKTMTLSANMKTKQKFKIGSAKTATLKCLNLTYFLMIIRAELPNTLKYIMIMHSSKISYKNKSLIHLANNFPKPTLEVSR